jgi:hypothetical protein
MKQITRNNNGMNNNYNAPRKTPIKQQWNSNAMATVVTANGNSQYPNASSTTEIVNAAIAAL